MEKRERKREREREREKKKGRWFRDETREKTIASASAANGTP